MRRSAAVLALLLVGCSPLPLEPARQAIPEASRPVEVQTHDRPRGVSVHDPMGCVTVELAPGDSFPEASTVTARFVEEFDPDADAAYTWSGSTSTSVEGLSIGWATARRPQQSDGGVIVARLDGRMATIWGSLGGGRRGTITVSVWGRAFTLDASERTMSLVPLSRCYWMETAFDVEAGCDAAEHTPPDSPHRRGKK